jgi:pyruvate dehydrogenase E2 component (dihydrolipoamide acetyltransferase)
MGVFRMPSLGSDMEAGTLVEWLVKPGDTVNRGDVVAVVETQKGAIEIETFESGVVRELIAEIGRTLPVGEPLARIGETEDESDAPKMPASAGHPAEVRSVASEPPPPKEPSDQAPVLTIRASPAARHAAQLAGLDLRTLSGTGPEGGIVLADVEAAATDVAPSRSDERRPLTEIRKAVAAAMSRSKREIPHFYVSHSIETQNMVDWLASVNAELPPSERILPGAVIVKAVALAARSVSALNGHFVDGAFVASDAVNTGIAIALRGGGLVAPSLENVDETPLAEVMAGMRDLVTRARSGHLRGSELTSGTLTISSLGEGGAEGMAGVIFPPQVALLTVGSPQTRPWVMNGTVVAREVTNFVVSADHRVCDGRQASKFLIVLQEKLATPETL